MKKLLALLCLLSGVAHGANTYTTNIGIPKPADSDTGWGTTLRAGFDIIDSSVAVLSGTNTFTGLNTFTQSIAISSPTFFRVYVNTATYAGGSQVLVVNGDGKFFGPLGAVVSLCDSNGLNCTNMSIDNLNPSNGITMGAINISSTVLLNAVSGTAGQVITSGGAGTIPSWTTVSGGGGGGSSFLQVTSGGVQITSPTASINFNSGQFSLAAVGSTSTVVLTPSSVTLQGQNVIRLTEVLQSGSTFYVSSGTVKGNLYVRTGTEGSPFGETNDMVLSPASTSVSNGGITYTSLNSPGSIPNFLIRLTSATAPSPYDLLLSPRTSLNTCTAGMRWGGTCLPYTGGLYLDNNGGGSTNSGKIEHTSDVSLNMVGGVTGTYLVSVGTSTTPNYYFAISTDGAVAVSGSKGTNGQALTSSGPTGPPTWTTISGGGSGGLVSLSTGIITPAVITSSSGLTVTYGVSAGSYSMTGAGNLSVTQNGYTGQVLVTTATPTMGQLPIFTSSVTTVATPLRSTLLAVDANGVLISSTVTSGSGSSGASGVVNASTQFQVPFYSVSGSSNVLSSSSNFTNNGTTITMSGVSTLVQTNVSTVTAVGVFFDYSQSSMTISSATISRQLRVNGNVFVSSGGVIQIQSAGNSASAQLSNSGGAGSSQLLVYATDGMGINNSPVSGVDLMVHGGTGSLYGRFAVLGTSASLAGTYSGFTSTNNVDASTLWSLPRKDGTANQPIVTDGAAHLSFGSTVSVSTIAASAFTFTQLGSDAPNGTLLYCSDCTVVTPATCTTNLLSSCVCAGSGTGAFAKRLNGTWYCD